MTARTRTFRGRGPVVAVVAIVLTIAATLGIAPASADPLADKRAQARRIASELDALGQRVSVLAEDLDSARLRATGLQTRAAAATRELAAAEEAAAGARTVLSQAAITTYMRSGIDTGVGVASPTGGTVDPLLRRQYERSIEGRRVEALDEMRAQLEVLAERRASLTKAQKDASAAVAGVERAQRESEAAASRQQAVLAEVQGDLVGLVAEAEEQRAAQEAAASQDAQRRAESAARDDAARRAPPTTRRASAPRPTAPQPAATQPAPAPAPSTPAASAGAQAAVEEARRQLGKPYRWGAAGPDRFDCSGLTMWAWRAGGRSLPHSSRAQYAALPKVSPSTAQPGDLFFFGDPIHHVGIYIGGGKMIAAPHSGTVVSVREAFRKDLVGVTRP